MTGLASELQHVISKHVAQATPEQIIAIASQLCAAQQVTTSPRAVESQWQVFDDDIAFDPVTGLYMTRDYVPGGQRNWDDSMRAASKINLRAWKWRAPTIHEQLQIVDYNRCEPAFNTDVFRGDSSWVWTSTPYKRSPSGCAWGVYFSLGLSGYDDHNGGGFVRAVCVGQ